MNCHITLSKAGGFLLWART